MGKREALVRIDKGSPEAGSGPRPLSPRVDLAAELLRLVREMEGAARALAGRDELVAGIIERWRGELARLLGPEATP